MGRTEELYAVGAAVTKGTPVVVISSSSHSVLVGVVELTQIGATVELDHGPGAPVKVGYAVASTALVVLTVMV
jgi:hypothetical protein